ncbi:hypothetical protein [Streptomyces luteireticuli]|uniref:hypothetical protein n=1 Tax=Streptomyces luteireticuli TaxID=173858 RepID=UPI003558492B
MDIAQELAPYLTGLAGALGTAVMTQATERFSEVAVAEGEGFFRRLVREHGRGRERTPTLDGPTADRLDGLLRELGAEDRNRLAEALTAWLREEPGRLDEGHLMAHVRKAVEGPTVIHHNATTHGSHSIAATQVHTIYMGDDKRPQGRP